MQNPLAEFLLLHHSQQSRLAEQIFIDLTLAIENGSSCIDLVSYARQRDLPLENLLTTLACDQAHSIVSSPPHSSPITLSGHFLYLHRFHHLEERIAQSLRLLCSKKPQAIDETARALIELLFPPVEGETIDYQREAAIACLENAITIVSGGPGTGKTSTVVKILALLLLSKYFEKAEDVLLIAPTGKAANRLSQSIEAGKQQLLQLLPIGSIDIRNIPSQASTLHRSIGLGGSFSKAKFNASKPLPHRLIIVDETSMIDLNLMHQLLDAISSDCKIIFLGDKNQLSSVQVGTIMADLSASADSSILKSRIVHLQKTYRNTGQIKSLCDAIKKGHAESAWNILTNPIVNENASQVKVVPPPKSLYRFLYPFVKKYWLPLFENKHLTLAQRCDGYEVFKILCPTRHGRFGIHAVQDTIHQILKEHDIPTHQDLFDGMPVIVTSNDYQNQIFNGDTGLVHQQNKELKVCFTEGTTTRSLTPSLLPLTEPAWALTIHKTQGSEYEHVLILLPEDEEQAKHLSRELIYTAVSRAKKSLTISSSKQVLQEAIETPIERASGIQAKLKS